MHSSSGDKLSTNIERLAAYTAAHPELRTAHHLLYDLRFPKGRYDFHDDVGTGRSAIRWSKAARYFLDEADYVLAEIFFWSSYDGRIFRERFGPMEKSPHLAICTEMNRNLIDVYQPRAVVLPGLTYARLVQRLYGLTHEKSIDLGGVRVAEHYSDGLRPWVFTKHWTAAFGFSKAQREIARDTIRTTSAMPLAG